ncbi:MAG: CHRD domain-containing protein [Chloroflexi bacterium]|nr:CHRD domain-containing protein [Chloroflexota bacterium]
MANMTGAEEVPPITTAAMGNATFMVSADGMSMTFTLNVSNMNNITASHIHLAAMGVNGPVVVPLFVVPGGKPGMFTGVLAEGTITAANLGGLLAGKPLSALIDAMNAGNTYVNVHTMTNPGGEIRGQIRMAP